MDLAELVQTFRSRADDSAQPPLWTDTEIISYINEAQREACIRAKLIEDMDTPEVTRLALRAGKGLYDLHCSILWIRRVYLQGSNVALTESSVEYQDEAAFADWMTRVGTPRWFIFYEGNSQIRFIDAPKAADTAILRVHRLPLRPMKSPTDRLEIHEKHHFRLLDWALRLAYLKQDADTYDEQKAQKYEAMFTASFGIREDANVLRKHADKDPPIIRPNWP